jgi:hypothetical protein
LTTILISFIRLLYLHGSDVVSWPFASVSTMFIEHIQINFAHRPTPEAGMPQGTQRTGFDAVLTRPDGLSKLVETLKVLMPKDRED